MIARAHLSDDRIIEICVAGALTRAEDQHVATCAACRSRQVRLEALLHEMSGAATAAADEAFSDERLAVQRSRILQRIEQDGRPARVIAFPASSSPEVRPLRARPAARWIAAAAAAGLAVGLLAGHLAHDLPSPGGAGRPDTITATASRPAPAPAMRAVNASLNEEELLGEIEMALEGPSPTVLRAFNDLTPH